MPLAFSRTVLIAAALAFAGALLVAVPSPAAAASTAAVEVDLARLVNAERARHGSPPLRIDVRLVASSRAWSQHQAATGTLAHDPRLRERLPSGVTAWAENVGVASGTSDLAARLHQQFMGSSSHRAALLDRRYTDLGIGIAAGGGSTYVTQRFAAGAPARVAAAVEPTAALAERHWGSGSAGHAVVARDDVYADALASGPLARGAGPILLTPPGPALHPRVRLALERTLPRGGTVWITGGTAAVSAEAERELSHAGWRVQRIAGENRFETAAGVSRAIVARDGPPDTVMVATAAGWADAAAGGAFGARSGAPVLLALHGSVPDETRAALGAFKPRRVVALGGSAVLSDRVVSQLGAQRVAGPSRQGTSAAVAGSLWGYTDRGPALWTAVPGYGDDGWTWALGVAPVAARRQAPVLLLGPELSPPVRDYLAGLYGGSHTAELFEHGPVPAATADQVRALLR